MAVVFQPQKFLRDFVSLKVELVLIGGGIVFVGLRIWITLRELGRQAVVSYLVAALIA